jgi:glycosyltransferase involved in cell wall biosynthesis
MVVTYISWAPHCSRSDTTARELQGKSHMVYWAGMGSRRSTVLLKYIGQAVWTWWILLRDRPDAVFVMSPPVIAGLVVFPYCAIRGIPFVVDAHTGAFLDRRWRHFQKLQLWLCRKATTTIVTNAYLADLLARHGADSTILPDVPVKYPPSESQLQKTGFCIAVICSFDYDEPVDLILQTARALPDVSFHVTGDPRKLERLNLQLPQNLRLTGFLDDRAYGQLLRDADVVMALTTGKHKMLRAAYEAIYEGTPIIISDSPMLREAFDQGAILVENSTDAITTAVREMQQHLESYRAEARELRSRKERRWQANKALLTSKIRRETKGAVQV